MALTQKERILKAKIGLNATNPFFSYILMNMEIERSEASEKIPTMGVNQYGDLFWNEDFVTKLSDSELNGVLAHEAMHMATLTFQRQKSRDMMLWNIATDLVINCMITSDGMSLPEGVCVPDSNGEWEFTGKNKKKVKIQIADRTAEEVYDDIVTDCEHIQSEMAGENGEGSYKGQIDSHLPGDENDKGESTGKGRTEADVKANQEAWKKKTSEAVTAAKMRGKMSASIEREFDGILNPKIDWRKKLSQYITRELPVDYTMARPGRRYYTTGIYYPSVKRENLEVIVGIDISGSIGGEEYVKFISECVGIASSFEQINMRLIWWSTYVDPKDDILITPQNKNDITNYIPHGGGGTEMSCFADYIEKMGYNSRVYVILTDGYIETKPKMPNGNALFVLSDHSQDDIVQNYGDVTRLRDIED